MTVRLQTAMTEATDEELMLRVQGDEPRLLSVLFERHHRRVYNYLLRMSRHQATAEDLTSEVFVRILKYRSSYRHQARFTTWLFQVARNLFLDHLERQRPEDSYDDLPPAAASDPVHPEEVLQSSQETRLIREALNRLPPRKREVLFLSRYRDMRYEDIAEVMGCTPGAVKILVHRSLKELGEIYRQISAGGRA